MRHRATIGVTADVQCGGWSTVLLNSTGQLFSLGVLNGQTEFGSAPLTELKFPPAYPATSSSRYEPSTAVQQFSVGRCRALALADDGKIWEWPSFKSPAQFVKFFTLGTTLANSRYGEGKVTKVIAGWAKASAYVTGTGIVWWSEQPDDDETAGTDGFIVKHYEVPGTAYRRAHPNRVSRDAADISVGEVTEYVFLDNYIVFTTHLNKLFAYPTNNPHQTHHLTPVELTQFYQSVDPTVKSVQGSFLKFGVFLTNGAVLIGTKDLLDHSWAVHASNATFPPDEPSPEPLTLPALQSSSVISLAFGDYHFHALHANGHITSYGTESQACGSLGLGDHSISRLRGVFYARRNTGDGQLQIPPWSDGRRTVWFEDEKQQWLVDTCQKGATNEASPRALRLAEDVPTTELVGEWFERGGRDWAKGPDGTQQDHEDEDGVDAYFGLKIAAAGHSSAALILVNEEKRDRVREKYVVLQPKLPEMEESTAGANTDTGPAASRSILDSVSSSVLGLGRWMLGLDARDVREEQERRQREGEEQGLSEAELRRARREEINYRSTYVWDQQPFPRLRFPNGDTMSGEVEVTEWKGGEPDFSVNHTTNVAPIVEDRGA
jgi:SCF-associated factor 1